MTLLFSRASGAGACIATLSAALLLAGCSDTSDDIELRPQGSDPADVVAALSVGGRLDSETATSYESAVACATALNLTADRLQLVVSGSDREQVAFARRAAELYLDRAVTAGEAEGADKRSVTAVMNRQMSEKRDDLGSQAQFAIACLRALQGAQST